MSGEQVHLTKLVKRLKHQGSLLQTRGQKLKATSLQPRKRRHVFQREARMIQSDTSMTGIKLSDLNQVKAKLLKTSGRHEGAPEKVITFGSIDYEDFKTHAWSAVDLLQEKELVDCYHLLLICSRDDSVIDVLGMLVRHLQHLNENANLIQPGHCIVYCEHFDQTSFSLENDLTWLYPMMDNTLVYLDDVQKPSILNELASVWRVYEVFEAEIVYKLTFSEKAEDDQVNERFLLLASDVVFKDIDLLDPTNMAGSDGLSLRFVREQSSALKFGFRSIVLTITKELSKFLVNDILDTLRINAADFESTAVTWSSGLMKVFTVMISACSQLISFNQLSSSQDLLETLLETLRKCLDDSDVNAARRGVLKCRVIDCLILLSDVNFKNKNFIVALSQVEQAKSYLDTDLPSQNANKIKIRLGMKRARITCHMGKKFHEAVTQYENLLSIFEANDKNPVIAEISLELGKLYRSYVPNYQKAIENLETACNIFAEESGQGERYAKYDESLIELGYCYFQRASDGDLKRAMDCYDKAIRVTSANVGSLNKRYAQEKINIGTCYDSLRRPVDALECFKEALEASELATGRASTETAKAHLALGKHFFHLLQPDLQRTIFHLSTFIDIALLDKNGLSKKKRICEAFSLLGKAYERVEDPEEAARCNKEANRLKEEFQNKVGELKNF